MKTQITRTLTDCMGGDEGKDRERDDAEILRFESPCAESERDDVSEGADDEQLFPSDAINQPEAGEGEDKVGETDADGLEQSRLGAESGHFKNAGCEVEDGVDAGELVEERDERRGDGSEQSCASGRGLRTPVFVSRMPQRFSAMQKYACFMG